MMSNTNGLGFKSRALVRKRPRAISTIVAALAVALPIAAVDAPTVSAGAGGVCATGYVCIWIDPGYVGVPLAGNRDYFNDKPTWDSDVYERDSSWKNRSTAKYVAFYENPGYTQNWCAAPATNYPNTSVNRGDQGVGSYFRTNYCAP